MNRPTQNDEPFFVPMQMVYEMSLTPENLSGSDPMLKSVWLCAADRLASDAWLALAVAEYPLSNAELLNIARLKKLDPPQSWYDEDHEGLY